MDQVSAVLGIVLIDLVLSGDNAIVIGMAAHRLPPQQRRLAIVLGGGLAIALRITLTAMAALLLAVPGLRAIGGVLLLWIAYRLLRAEEGGGETVKAAGSLRDAVFTILVADFIMSLDNVLGVAGASHGNLPLLLFGLILSVAILMVGGSLVAGLINRFWWLAYIGAAVIAWTGTNMVMEDPFIQERIGHLSGELQLIVSENVTLAVLGLAYYIQRYRPQRRPT